MGIQVDVWIMLYIYIYRFIFRYTGETCYMPVDKDTVKDYVKGFLKSRGRTIQSVSFKNNVPDDNWVSLLFRGVYSA